MKEFNPLLVAIAHKKLEVVRYLLHEYGISLKNFGKNPYSDMSDSPLAPLFSLELTVATKDDKMLDLLWGKSNCWEAIHLK